MKEEGSREIASAEIVGFRKLQKLSDAALPVDRKVLVVKVSDEVKQSD